MTAATFPPIDLLYPTHSFSLADYHRMIEVGILGDEDKVELLNGKIVPMSPIGRFHAACVSRITDFLVPHLVGRFQCRQEQPITLPTGSEPEPDFVIATLREDRYANGHPTPEEVHLLIEVADKTLERDRGAKASIYAAAGIPEYWIINLIDRQIEWYRQPDPEKARYAETIVRVEKDVFEHPLTGELAVSEFMP